MLAAKVKFLILCGLAGFCFGCATPAKQTQALLRDPQGLPTQKQIDNVPFIDQPAGYCGPATLTMVLRWAGQQAVLDEIAPEVYTPGMKGSLQMDMISASRRHGMMAVPIKGLPSLLQEVKEGHPVIIFENLGLSWAPQWHYAVVLGYDLPDQKIIMHSGHEAFKHWDMSHFERSWMLGDYWGLVVLPAGDLALSAGELANVSAAAGLEQSGQVSGAEKSYQAVLKQWPGSLAALIGLGNIAYSKKDFKQAVQFLVRATRAYPDAAAAWHNLAIAQSAAGMNAKAHASAQEALKLVATPLKASYQQSLRSLL